MVVTLPERRTDWLDFWVLVGSTVLAILGASFPAACGAAFAICGWLRNFVDGR